MVNIKRVNALFLDSFNVSLTAWWMYLLMFALKYQNVHPVRWKFSPAHFSLRRLNRNNVCLIVGSLRIFPVALWPPVSAHNNERVCRPVYPPIRHLVASWLLPKLAVLVEVLAKHHGKVFTHDSDSVAKTKTLKWIIESSTSVSRTCIYLILPLFCASIS